MWPRRHHARTPNPKSPKVAALPQPFEHDWLLARTRSSRLTTTTTVSFGSFASLFTVHRPALTCRLGRAVTVAPHRPHPRTTHVLQGHGAPHTASSQTQTRPDRLSSRQHRRREGGAGRPAAADADGQDAARVACVRLAALLPLFLLRAAVAGVPRRHARRRGVHFSGELTVSLQVLC